MKQILKYNMPLNNSLMLEANRIMFILNLIKNAKHFSIRFSYTDRNRRSIIANLFRIGIIKEELKFA